MYLKSHVKCPVFYPILTLFEFSQQILTQTFNQNSFYQQMYVLLNIQNVKIYIEIYSLLHVWVHLDHSQGPYTEPG